MLACFSILHLVLETRTAAAVKVSSDSFEELQEFLIVMVSADFLHIHLVFFLKRRKWRDMFALLLSHAKAQSSARSVLCAVAML